MYSLVGSFPAHTKGVKCLAYLGNGEFATGSQDASPHAIRWRVSHDPENGISFDQVGATMYHQHWVTAATFLTQPMDGLPAGTLITGCLDSQIRLFDASGNSIANLSGHEKGVISFSWTASGKLISGSWDGTARIWNIANRACEKVLKGHENGVQALGMPDGSILTTSTGENVGGQPANFQIRHWSSNGDLTVPSIRDHLGSIRSICPVPTIGGFATCSNNGDVKIRTADGAVVGEYMHVPETFVLNVTNLNSAEEGVGIVSCGENGSVVVYAGDSVSQTINHPCCVWCAMALTDAGYEGDFITAGDDGVIRYFSKDPSKMTGHAIENQILFEEQVSAALAARNTGPSAEEIAKATPWELCTTVRGKKDGQVMVFNKGGKLIAAQWSQPSSCWIEIGDVTGNGGEGGSIDGVAYDHVMPVEVETNQGLQTYQLGFNAGENPHTVAMRFMDKYGLPNSYRQQIADWVTKRMGSSASTIDMSGGGHSAPSVFRFSKLAHGFIVFDDVIADFKNKAFNKIVEFNTAENSLLNEAELASVQGVLQTLSETSWYHSSKVDKQGCAAIFKMVQSFDPARVFPIFDVMRLLAIHGNGADTIVPRLGEIVKRSISILQSVDPKTVNASLINTILMISRFVCNCFKEDGLRNALFGNISLCSDLLQSLSSFGVQASLVPAVAASPSAKNVRLAISVLVTNLGAMLNRHISNGQAYAPVFCSLVLSILQGEDGNSKTVKNALIGYGTALTNASLKNLLVASEVNKGVLSQFMSSWKGKENDTEVAALVTEIVNSLL